MGLFNSSLKADDSENDGKFVEIWGTLKEKKFHYISAILKSIKTDTVI